MRPGFRRLGRGIFFQRIPGFPGEVAIQIRQLLILLIRLLPQSRSLGAAVLRYSTHVLCQDPSEFFVMRVARERFAYRNPPL